MGNLDKIVKEIIALYKNGIDSLQVQKGKEKDLVKLSLNYESWYTKASAVISQVIPERLSDFKAAYKRERRKEIVPENYTISDYLIGLVIERAGSPTFNTDQVYQIKLLTQISILKSALEAAPSALRDIRGVLRAELFDNDISAAKELVKSGYLRSAGIICGVVLEAHLKSVAERRGITLKKTKTTINYLNNTLKNNNVYDVPTWRLVSRLGDIRNLCGHSKDRDPTLDEVQDLISGTEKILKEIF